MKHSSNTDGSPLALLGLMLLGLGGLALFIPVAFAVEFSPWTLLIWPALVPLYFICRAVGEWAEKHW